MDDTGDVHRNSTKADGSLNRLTIETRDHMDNCAAFVVVATLAVEESVWVGREIRRSQTQDKTILPLLLDAGCDRR